MGGLRRAMPWTTTTFLVGALALSGVFPFSGFWSKDDILTTLWNSGHLVAFWFALAVAALTAFYMTRLCVRVFGDNACSLAREGHRTMVAPMALLAGITTIVGFSSQAFARFLLGEVKGPLNLPIALTGTAFALGGIAIGLWVYVFKGLDTERLKARVPYVYAALQQKLYFDLVYDRVFVQGFQTLSGWLARFDVAVIDGAVNGAAQAWSAASALMWRGDVKIVDGAVNGVGSLVKHAGARAREIETGRLQTYQRVALGGLLVLLVLSIVLLRGA